MAVSVLTAPLPTIELGPGASVQVSALTGAITVDSLIVYGTYFPPDGGPAVPAGPFLLVPGPES